MEHVLLCLFLGTLDIRSETADLTKDAVFFEPELLPKSGDSVAVFNFSTTKAGAITVITGRKPVIQRDSL